jgi:hypothetical protein
MNPRIAASILILLALFWPSAGLESLHLGSGLSDQVINLDAGAKVPGENPQFKRSGFATPNMPQQMALSPNVMVTQAKELLNEAATARNESLSARDEAAAMYGEVKTLLAKVDEMEQSIRSLLNRAESAAEATAAGAAQARGFLNRTDEAYRETLALSLQVQENLSQMKSILMAARDYAESSAKSADQASDSLNRTFLVYNETAVIFNRASAAFNSLANLAEDSSQLRDHQDVN